MPMKRAREDELIVYPVERIKEILTSVRETKKSLSDFREHYETKPENCDWLTGRIRDTVENCIGSSVSSLSVDFFISAMLEKNSSYTRGEIGLLRLIHLSQKECLNLLEERLGEDWAELPNVEEDEEDEEEDDEEYVSDSQMP